MGFLDQYYRMLAARCSVKTGGHLANALSFLASKATEAKRKKVIYIKSSNLE